MNSAKVLGAFGVFGHYSRSIILRTKSYKSAAIYNLTFQLRIQRGFMPFKRQYLSGHLFSALSACAVIQELV